MVRYASQYSFAHKGLLNIKAETNGNQVITTITTITANHITRRKTNLLLWGRNSPIFIIRNATGPIGRMYL